MYDKVNWNFDNSYAHLSEPLFSHISTTPVAAPKLILFNAELSQELNLDFTFLSDDEKAQLFSGNNLPKGATPIAQSYAGHQYGNFTMLGDGRAILLGEHIAFDNQRFDIQLKGAGPTPYSRQGDGRAALGPMLREYIISEAMHALKIPTTRSLAVVFTGESVRREKLLPGAILTRIAQSHIRVGTFEYIAALGDVELLKTFVTYTIKRHYPYLQTASNSAQALLEAVMGRQIALIIHWMRVGFIHGVMNTDNMSICGETIDYGPCAFMNAYAPETVFSSIDRNGRYAFGNQPKIAQWNLVRFAEALLPLLHDSQEKAIQIATETLKSFVPKYHEQWLLMMRQKLGFLNAPVEEEILMDDLLLWMQNNQADYTNTFCVLMSTLKNLSLPEMYQKKEFLDWRKRWLACITQDNTSFETAHALMRTVNPVVIPRNHQVELALQVACEQENLEPIHQLLAVLSKPYEDTHLNLAQYQALSQDKGVYQTFCGT